MTDRPTVARTTTALMAEELAPRHHVTHRDGRHCVALSPMYSVDTFYLEGTLDELAAFVLALAGVVRELNAAELGVPTFDGTRAPVVAVVDAMRERFGSKNGGGR